MNILNIAHEKLDLRSESKNAFHVCKGDTLIASIPYGVTDEELKTDLSRESALSIANQIVALSSLLKTAINLNNWSIAGGYHIDKIIEKNRETLKAINYI